MLTDSRVRIAVAGVFYGTFSVGGSILTRLGMAPLGISLFYLVFAIVPLAPLAIKRNVFSKMRSASRYLLIYGIINTLLILSQFTSVYLGLPPSIATLLFYTQPMWTIIFGRIFFRETITVARLGIIILALLGTLLLANPFYLISQEQKNSFSSYVFGVSQSVVAELSALASGVFMSLWIILGKKGRIGVLSDPVQLTFAMRASSCIPLMAIAFASLVFRENLFLSDASLIETNLLPLFIYAIISGTIPDLLFYSGLGNVQSVQAGVILLLEPISAGVISGLMLHQTPTFVQIAGGVLILVSNYLVTKPSIIRSEIRSNI